MEADAQIGNLLDRIVDASSPTVVVAYEKCRAKPEREEILLAERASRVVPSKSELGEIVEPSLESLAKFSNIDEKGSLKIKRAVLSLVFPDPLRYSEENGYRIMETGLHFKMPVGACNQEGEMVLIDAVERPGGSRSKPPCPTPAAAHSVPHSRGAPERPLDGPHLGLPRRRFHPAAEGDRARRPPEPLCARIRAGFDPLPVWSEPREGAVPDAVSYPLRAIRQRPASIYHSRVGQHPPLRREQGETPISGPGEVCDAQGRKDGDRAWRVTRHARIRVQARRVLAVDPQTVRTWNTMARRPGAWALGDGAPGSVATPPIHERLHDREYGLRPANADPVTRRAPWDDLRVRMEMAEAPAGGREDPCADAQTSPGAPAPRCLRSSWAGVR